MTFCETSELSSGQDHSAPILSVRGLVKRFGRQTVFDQLDLDVQRGEVLGLVGASGAG